MGMQYKLNGTDMEVISAIRQLLRRLAVSSTICPAQLVSIAKVQYVLSRLPRVTEGVLVTIEISWRINQEGCSSTSVWHLSVGSEWLTLSCGGSEYTEGVGSDSFTTMTWSARPGERSEYDGSWDDAWMERDEYSDPPAYDKEFQGCSISIDDDDNPLLDKEPEDSEDDTAADASLELYRRGEKIDIAREEWEAALSTFQEMDWQPEMPLERYSMTPAFIKHDEGKAMQESGNALISKLEQAPTIILSLHLDVDLFLQLVKFVGDGAFIVGKPGAFEDATQNDF